MTEDADVPDALAAARGDTRARDRLYNRYRPLVERAARRWSNETTASEDLLQVGRESLLSAISEYRPDLAFRAYLRSRVYDALRKESGARRPALPGIVAAHGIAPGTPAEVTMRIGEAMAENALDPDADVDGFGRFRDADATFRRIMSADHGLTERERSVIRLLYRDAETLRSTAMTLGVSKSTVDRLHQSALEKLRAVAS